MVVPGVAGGILGRYCIASGVIRIFARSARESGKDQTLKKLLAIVKRDILPMLKEYWFDEQDKYEHWENQLLGLFK